MASATAKVSREAFRYAESLLYRYHEAKKELDRLREEILFSTRKSEDENVGGGRSNYPGDPVGTSVAALYSHRRVRELEESTRIIDEVYAQLPEEKKRLVQLYYWARPRTLTWDGIAMKIEKDGIPISRRTALRWRDEIVSVIAEKKGLL